MSGIPAPGPAAIKQPHESAGDRDADAAARLADLAEDVRFYAALWHLPGVDADDAARRRSLTRAVRRIDELCRAAYLLRSDLVQQARAFDDAVLASIATLPRAED